MKVVFEFKNPLLCRFMAIFPGLPWPPLGFSYGQRSAASLPSPSVLRCLDRQHIVNLGPEMATCAWMSAFHQPCNSFHVHSPSVQGHDFHSALHALLLLGDL